MSDRISLMLDNMVAAVEIGFSYDGIISVPETGLEDAGKRPGLSGLVDSGKTLVKTMIRAVKAAAKGAENILKPKPLPTPNSGHETSPTAGPPVGNDPESVPDSAIDPRKIAELPAVTTDIPTQQSSPVETQASDIEEERRETGSRAEEVSEPGSPPRPGVGPRQPRKRDNRRRDDNVHGATEVAQFGSTSVQESKGEQSREDDERLPRIRKDQKPSASEERRQIQDVVEESPDSRRLPRLGKKAKDPRKKTEGN